MQLYHHTLQFDVRDYECDLSGIVNNAVYQNYLEHARHQFLKSLEVDYSAWAQRGVHMVVIRSEIDYLSPLRSGDQFIIGTNPERVSRLRIAFRQDIYHLPDHKVILRAIFTCTAIDNAGRPRLPKELQAAFDQIFIERTP